MNSQDYEAAPVKVNLFLHITGRRADGYHIMQSLFAFADFGDRLEVAPAQTLSLSVTGPFAQPLLQESDNLVLRAARALRTAAAMPALGAALRLTKNVPVASGLGGGSADAAAALRLLNRFWGLRLPQKTLLVLARTLGADVPACLASTPQWAEGIGDELTPLEAQHCYPILIINPGSALATARVFEHYKKHGQFRSLIAKPAPAELLATIKAASNDLEPAACALAPEITELLHLLQDCSGMVFSRMSGSGASCFALFKTHAAQEQAAFALRQRFPAAWIYQTTLRF
jgi:4-diphosphocytidyl-2-C-methyl-D-erythritol kinase